MERAIELIDRNVQAEIDYLTHWFKAFEEGPEKTQRMQESREGASRRRNALLRVAALPGPFFAFGASRHDACSGAYDCLGVKAAFEDAVGIIESRNERHDECHIAAVDGESFAIADWFD